MLLHVSSTCAHHQEVITALHSLWYHHTYRCDDTYCKLTVQQKFCASSWLIRDKYTELHGQQNDKYTELHGQQNDKYTELHGQQNDKKKPIYIFIVAPCIS